MKPYIWTPQELASLALDDIIEGWHVGGGIDAYDLDVTEEDVKEGEKLLAEALSLALDHLKQQRGM